MCRAHTQITIPENRKTGVVKGHVEGLAQEHFPELKSMFTQCQDPLSAQHNGWNKPKTVMKLENTDNSGKTLSISHDEDLKQDQIS